MTMLINADFDKRVLVHAEDVPWQASPTPEITRRPLDRIGDEVARATTLVRYEPNSEFPAHTHGGGEEFIVLEGVFEDEHGAYPAGSYLRNPPTSSHTPGSKDGCLIFVKLWQFDAQDRTHVRLKTEDMIAKPAEGRTGVFRIDLFEDDRETVVVESWNPGTTDTLAHEGGMELLVLEGSMQADGETLTLHSWLRLPIGDSVNLTAGKEGVRFYLKNGHLRHVSAPTS